MNNRFCQLRPFFTSSFHCQKSSKKSCDLCVNYFTLCFQTPKEWKWFNISFFWLEPEIWFSLNSYFSPQLLLSCFFLCHATLSYQIFLFFQLIYYIFVRIHQVSDDYIVVMWSDYNWCPTVAVVPLIPIVVLTSTSIVSSMPISVAKVITLSFT